MVSNFSLSAMTSKILLFMILLMAIMSTALLTLQESVVLSSMQASKGPTKIIYGFFQPMVDAFKLIFKEFVVPDKSYKLVFVYIALFGFMCSASMMMFMPFTYHLIMSNTPFSFLFFYLFNLLHVYSMLLSGWASSSKYSFLGCVSSSAQLMSYDMLLALVILNVFCFIKTLNIVEILIHQVYFGLTMCFLPFQFSIFLMSGAAETSSHPFDLPEAEPELVSGYNVEYSAISFALFFLSEYLSVMLFSTVVVLIFFGGWSNYFVFQSLEYILKITVMMFIVLKLSALLPSYSVDQLMRVSWKYLIPFETVNLMWLMLLIFM